MGALAGRSVVVSSSRETGVFGVRNGADFFGMQCLVEEWCFHRYNHGTRKGHELDAEKSERNKRHGEKRNPKIMKKTKRTQNLSTFTKLVYIKN